jgi:hypothetical protein
MFSRETFCKIGIFFWRNLERKRTFFAKRFKFRKMLRANLNTNAIYSNTYLFIYINFMLTYEGLEKVISKS